MSRYAVEFKEQVTGNKGKKNFTTEVWGCPESKNITTEVTELHGGLIW